MSRLVLKSKKLVPDKFPLRLRGSTAANWYWCAEKCRLKALGVTEEREATEVMLLGNALHEKLTKEQGRRFPWEDQFFHEIDTQRVEELGYVRRFHDTDIYGDLTGHPDDFQTTLDMQVTLIEYKTTNIKNEYHIWRYRRPVASFQVQIYCYILEPILAKLGYTLTRSHAVIFYDQTLQLINVYPVHYRPDLAERDIDMVIAGIKDPKKIIKCQQWKCNSCSKEYKEECQFWQGRSE